MGKSPYHRQELQKPQKDSDQKKRPIHIHILDHHSRGGVGYEEGRPQGWDTTPGLLPQFHGWNKK